MATIHFGVYDYDTFAGIPSAIVEIFDRTLQSNTDFQCDGSGRVDVTLPQKVDDYGSAAYMCGAKASGYNDNLLTYQEDFSSDKSDSIFLTKTAPVPSASAGSTSGAVIYNESAAPTTTPQPVTTPTWETTQPQPAPAPTPQSSQQGFTSLLPSAAGEGGAASTRRPVTLLGTKEPITVPAQTQVNPTVQKPSTVGSFISWLRSVLKI